MKITETQIRQVIKEEIQNVLNEMHDEKEPSLGLTGGKVAGMVGGAAGLNVLIKMLEKAVHEHPEWRDQLEQVLVSGHDTIHNIGHAVGSMFENKKRN